MEQGAYQYRKETVWCQNDGRRIFGTVFIPEADGPFPMVVFSHELGASHRSGAPYARRLAAAGCAVCIFDFCGGCAVGGRSDGSTTEMTLSSERSDLETVLAAAEAWDFADPTRIVLMGASQGGVVSALTACRRPERFAGLILLYPAFSAIDHMRALFASPAEIPEEFDMFCGWIRLGRAYAEELWDADFYAELSRYPGRVLLLHGDSDGTVPLSYSQRAAEALPRCEFHVIPGGEHGFAGPQLEDAMQYIVAYLESIV